MGGSLASGYVSRDRDGGFRGAGGNLGINETIGGTNVQAVNVGGDFGWGGDRDFYGARANATLAGVSHDPAAAGTSGFWGGVKTFDAAAGAYHDGQAGSGGIGFNADIISGEVGYRSVDANSDTDRGLKIGAGIGAKSGGVRWYDQDADHDGRREYGLGLSLPIIPVGFDYTTEQPIGDLASLALMGPAGLALNWGMDAVGLGEYSPGALMQDAGEWIGDNAPAAWDATTDFAGDVWNGATDAVGGAWDGATDAVGGAWNGATDAIGSFFSGW